jgi:hypothetical protein
MILIWGWGNADEQMKGCVVNFFLAFGLVTVISEFECSVVLLSS